MSIPGQHLEILVICVAGKMDRCNNLPDWSAVSPHGRWPLVFRSHPPVRILICVTGGWQMSMLRHRPPIFGRFCSSKGFGSLNDAESVISSNGSSYPSGWRYSNRTMQPQLTKKEQSSGENGEHPSAGRSPISCRSLLELWKAWAKVRLTSSMASRW